MTTDPEQDYIDDQQAMMPEGWPLPTSDPKPFVPPVTTETGGLDLDGPMIIASMRRDPAAEVRVVPSIKGHGMSGQVASAVLAYVDGLLAEVERLRKQNEGRRKNNEALAHEASGLLAERDKAYSESTRLRAQRQAVRDLVAAARAEHNPADITPWVAACDVEAALEATG